MKKIFPFCLAAILAVTGCNKKDVTETINETASVMPAAPLSVGFTIVDEPSVMEGLPAQFRNSSINAVSYKWDFGTGDLSTDKEPVYTFPGCGPKTVMLTATDAAGKQQSYSILLQVNCSGKHAQGH